MTKSSDELKELIRDNPNLPIVVLAGDEANSGDYCWMFCSCISYGIEEILDCDYLDYNDCVFVDREHFAESVADDVAREHGDLPEDEFWARVDARIAEYEPFWTKVIAIYATN